MIACWNGLLSNRYSRTARACFAQGQFDNASNTFLLMRSCFCFSHIHTWNENACQWLPSYVNVSRHIYSHPVLSTKYFARLHKNTTYILTTHRSSFTRSKFDMRKMRYVYIYESRYIYIYMCLYIHIRHHASSTRACIGVNLCLNPPRVLWTHDSTTFAHAAAARIQEVTHLSVATKN